MLRAFNTCFCWATLIAGVALLSSATQAPAATNDETPAERGYRLLTTKPYFQRDFDLATFDQLWQVWEEPSRSRAAQADAPARRKLAFERYGLMDVPGRDSGVPLQYVATPDGGWTVNCFSCHGGKVAGQVIPGLPNSHVAIATLQDDLHAYLKANGRGNEIADNGMPGVPLGGSIGTTNSVVFGIALGSRRDLGLNYVADRPAPIMLHHDHDAPPWWNVKRKKMLYIDGFAPKAHRALMPFLMIPQTTADKFPQWEDDFKDILAYIESIPAPKYPFSIDQELATQGQKAFNRVCAECHGTYGADGVYPERNVAIDEVGTDPLRWKALSPGNRLGHQASWFGNKGKHKVNARPEGYVAPPLDGVWASAPYLHNGAIPTLWHLFHAAQRPIVWTRSEDGYDQQRVGIEVTELTDIPAEAAVPAQRRRYFDTRMPGKSAAGHEFPEQLTAEEKTAVIEYLKTL